jgi:hypothetical protein
VPLMLHVILLKLSCRWCCWRNFSTSFLCYRFSKPMGIFIDTYGTSKPWQTEKLLKK